MSLAQTTTPVNWSLQAVRRRIMSIRRLVGSTRRCLPRAHLCRERFICLSGSRIGEDLPRVAVVIMEPNVLRMLSW
jgi:hypothetical protein